MDGSVTPYHKCPARIVNKLRKDSVTLTNSIPAREHSLVGQPGHLRREVHEGLLHGSQMVSWKCPDRQVQHLLHLWGILYANVSK